MNLQDSVIVITGASRGLGRAMALTLAQGGARLALVARQWQALEATAQEIRDGGGEALAISADISDEQQVTAMAEQVLAHYGRVDVLVNNAGLMIGDLAFTDMSPNQCREIIDTNLWGAYLCCHALVPAMLRQGAGVIINISSGAAVRTGFLNIPYGVSKAGLDRLTLGLDAEFASQGIACVSLSPSVSSTDTVRRMYAGQNVDAWAQPPAMAARALRSLLEDDILQYSGQVLSAREYLERQEAD